MPTSIDNFDAAPDSFGALFRKRVAETPNDVALSAPDYAPGANTWTPYTWAETKVIVDEIAAGLIGRGLRPEERVAICSTTRIEWVFMDYGIACAAGATTTIYPNTGPGEVKFIITDSGSKVVVVEDRAQLDKIINDDDITDQVHTIVVLLPDGVELDERVLSLEQLRAEGRDVLAERSSVVDDAIAATGRDDLATLIYTSGTTGRPKGVRLPHRVWIAQAVGLVERDLIRPGTLMYLWLPLSHVFGKALLAASLGYNIHNAVDGRIDRIVQGLAETRPGIMCGAPRIFEKVRAAVITGKGVKGRISHWAFAVGRDAVAAREAGELRGLLKVKYALAEKLVFSKLKAKLGGRMEFMISGSAQLNKQVQTWFNSAGITIIEGYGSTETSAIATVDQPQNPRFGTVGLPLPRLETKLADDGELLVRGPSVFSGYHNLPEVTAEALDADGWFRTGDIAEIDDSGRVRITDRKKDLFKTSGGKYVSPQKVEAALTTNIPYISQAIAVGEGRKYVSALVVMDPQLLKSWAEKRGLADLSYAELSQRPEIAASLEKQLAKANSRLERWETVKKFAILDHELTVENGGTTANMKIRRSIVAKEYQDIVDGLYPKED
ncbi:long-chain fatty acid--CoA ligase [Tessaracoccus sp. OH4464_COT-324]|uniref:AMP-dependent synthetase/ligase n=1 Tax=Tessaracoccus sp. OH4464_COT-324 TaxID=2491059 RepID=UPI000F63F40C|nr:long-chain fatty acid--CoA ligase [Tessaracoccus sp. OH4464_COT-324]RRD46865.1 long-chain fatty acid--CoA ligase [Tessaracoccus sp. OH4464_COT-324]